MVISPSKFQESGFIQFKTKNKMRTSRNTRKLIFLGAVFGTGYLVYNYFNKNGDVLRQKMTTTPETPVVVA
jgi:hypothetical protein